MRAANPVDYKTKGCSAAELVANIRTYSAKTATNLNALDFIPIVLILTAKIPGSNLSN
jgi:hypothetical protein